MRINVGILEEETRHVFYHIIDTNKTRWVVHPTNLVSRYGKTYDLVMNAFKGRVKRKVYKTSYELAQKGYYGYIFKDGFWHELEPGSEKKLIVLDDDDIVEFLDSMDYELVTEVTDLRPRDILVHWKLILQIESCELVTGSNFSSMVEYKVIIVYLTNEGGLLLPTVFGAVPSKLTFNPNINSSSVVWLKYDVNSASTGFRLYRQKR